VPHGSSKPDDLPALEIESLDDEPVDGVTIVSGPRGPIPWGVVAIVGAGLLLLVIVSGLGGHGPESNQSDQAVIPTPAFVPSPVVTQPPGPLSLAFIYGRIAARVRMTEAIPSTQTVNFALEGAGGAPDRWYYLQVGVCPEQAPSVGAGAPARIDGTFDAEVLAQVPHGAPVWLRVVDNGGREFGTAYGRLFQTDFRLMVESGANVCQDGTLAPQASNVSVRGLEAVEQFAGHRATLTPTPFAEPGQIPVLTSADMLQRVAPVGTGTVELVLGRYTDAETGLVVDPAWVVIDRGEAHTVWVYDAVTGDFEFTFSGAPGAVTCGIAAGAVPDGCGAANAPSG
jgi:hypothetical protein